MRSEDEPPWWADRARENSHQHYRWFSQHQRAALPPQDGTASLCLFYTVVKREKSSHSALKVLFAIFYLIFSIFFSLDVILLIPRKPHVFPLPCYGYFHNGVSVLYVPLTQMLLCGRRWDIPVSTSKLLKLGS